METLGVGVDIIENSRINKVKHLIFASTSSVYGDNKRTRRIFKRWDSRN